MQTYEEILERMENKFSELAGFDANEASDIGIRLKVLAAEIFSAYTSLDWIKTQMFPQTASGEQLDLHAQQRGLTRKAAYKARGNLVFSTTLNAMYDLSIPKGTICSTAGVDGVRYVTTEDAVLVAGGNGTVTVPAEAEEGGTKGNTSTNTITVLVTPPRRIVGVTNTEAFTGGSECESDEELRQRIQLSYSNMPNGTNEGFYKDFVLRYEDVHSVSVVPRANGVGTVDVYVAGKGTTLSSSIKKEIEDALNEIKEINVDVNVKDPSLSPADIMVYIYIKDGYVFDDVKAACIDSIEEYFNSLSIGQKMWVSAMGNAIYNTEGVLSYKFDSSMIDKNVTQTQLAVPGTYSIIEGQ